MKTKGKAIFVFKWFKTLIELQLGKRIQTLRCDGGGEFKPITSFAREQGIPIQLSCPYTSSQNDRVERKHRHLVETGLALLAQAKNVSSLLVVLFSYNNLSHK